METELKNQIVRRFRYALKLVHKMGRILEKQFYSGAIRSFLKEGNETVTEFDLLIDRFLKTRLLGKFKDSWLSEESEAVSNQTGFEWVLDPIDGTNNFSLKVPFFCIALALKHNGELVMGIVYDPVHHITYYSFDKQSFIISNKKKASVNLSPFELQESLVSYGFHPDCSSHFQELSAAWQKIELQSKASRRLGSAALEITYVGVQKISVYWIMGAKEWDYAAALLFAENAGAKYIQNREKKYLLVYHPMVEEKILDFISLLEKHH